MAGVLAAARTGLQLGRVLGALNSSIRRVKDRTPEGMLALAQSIAREARPRVPVVTGALQKSGGAELTSRAPPRAKVEFKAAHAKPIHFAKMKLAGKPRRGAPGVYWGPRGTAGYLGLAAHTHKRRATKILRDRIKRK